MASVKDFQKQKAWRPPRTQYGYDCRSYTGLGTGLVFYEKDFSCTMINSGCIECIDAVIESAGGINEENIGRLSLRDRLSVGYSNACGGVL